MSPILLVVFRFEVADRLVDVGSIGTRRAARKDEAQQERCDQGGKQDHQHHHREQVARELDQRRQETIRTRFGKLIREGIEAGFLRKDIEAELLVFLFATLVQNVMSPETLSRLPLSASQAFAVISGVLFEGILTDKGRAKSREKES